MVPHNLLILTFPRNVNLKLTKELAETLAELYDGMYKGHAVGLGKADEYIYYLRKSNIEPSLKKLRRMITESDKYPKSISFTIRDTRETMNKAITGQVIAGKEISVKKQRRK
jgi:hypothetical protein